jgi:hypothetical protein
MLFGLKRRSLLSREREATTVRPVAFTIELEVLTMIRALALSTLATAAFALPALADSPATFDPAQTAAFSAELSDAAVAEQARLHLSREGFTGISPLSRDETGRWVGTANKDGQTIFVAVILPPHVASNAQTD